MNNVKERKVKQSKYGEETVVVRVPKSMLPAVQDMLKSRELLTVQWDNSQLPPKAQKLVELITELMITPQKALIEAYKETGSLGFHDEIERLNVELEVTRKAYRGTTTNALLEVLQAPL